MSELKDRFDQIYIHTDSEHSELARRARQVFPEQKISVVRARPFPESEGDLSAEEFSRSKRHLYICRHPGAFFKRCPGSRPGLACCNYFVLNLGLQCDMNCSYCYLQSFINTPVLTLYSNLDDALTEMRGLMAADSPLRIGTGEVMDSLSLDELTLHSRRLIEFFREFPNWTLEFKTKSDRVDQFLDVAHAQNVLVSWSINPQAVIAREEHGTASLQARLSAARRCRRAGFRVSFHLDPMLWHPEWRENYTSLVDEICTTFTPQDVPVLSVGTLRFQPSQRAMMRERFGLKSWVTAAEVFPGHDGKLRYDMKLRQEMYQTVLNRFRHHDERWNVFMCMESPETWLKTTGATPYQQQGLQPLFKTIRLNERSL